MPLQIRRIIVFAKNVASLAKFYEKKLGLRVLERSDDFVDFDAGACRLALHRAAKSRPNRTKVCFYAKDVSSTRARLIRRGVPMGKDPGPGPGLKLCDARDPEGNLIQLSNRK